MKKYIYIIGLISAIILSSCDQRDLEVPEIDVPEYVNSKSLQFITIAELKTLSASFPLPTISGYTNKAGDFEFRSIDNTNKAIKGIVVANDESGNIYKQFYIQDQTGAMIIGTNMTGMFSLYRVGQEVIVELDGLCVGKYGGSFQIGSRIPYVSYNTDGTIRNASIGRMTPTEFYTHVHRNASPNPAAVVPAVLTTMPEVNENNRSTLVRFDNISFENGGKGIFATKGSGYGGANLVIGGQKILVRTSEYANFAADTIPAGTGSVICVLGKYNSTVQLTIRNRTDMIFN
jgi:hypothetical protein